MTQKKKPTRLRGLVGKIRDYSAANFTATHPILIAHAAHPTSGTGHFCTETARVQQQADAEYDAADPLVQPQVSVATMATSPKGMVLETHRQSTGRTAPSVRFRHAQIPTGFGVDGPNREAGSIALTDVFQHLPHHALKRRGGLQKSRQRSMTMPTGTPTGASAQITHDRHQAALVLRAQNHLALALFELRNNTGTTPIRKAMGLAYAAARSLSQVVGGAHHV